MTSIPLRTPSSLRFGTTSRYEEFVTRAHNLAVNAPGGQDQIEQSIRGALAGGGKAGEEAVDRLLTSQEEQQARSRRQKNL